MKKKLVAVYRARGDSEARLIQSKLENFGIPSIIKSNAAPSVVVVTVDGLGEYKVMVWEEFAEEAAELLAEQTPEEDV
jgi:hypothetical protein